MSYKDYIGDGVYVDFDGNQIKLYIDEGFGQKDTIYLEPYVLEALNRYAKRVLERPRPAADDAGKVGEKNV